MEISFNSLRWSVKVNSFNGKLSTHILGSKGIRYERTFVLGVSIFKIFYCIIEKALNQK